MNINWTYGSSKGVITWNGEEASAPILLNGDSTGFLTADAGHSATNALKMVLRREFGLDMDLDQIDYEFTES